MAFFGLFQDEKKPNVGFYSQDEENAGDNKKLLSQKKEVLSRFEMLNQQLQAAPPRQRGGTRTTQGPEGLWMGG